MKYLTNLELRNIKGGSFSSFINSIFKIYKYIKIKILINKVFID